EEDRDRDVDEEEDDEERLRRAEELVAIRPESPREPDERREREPDEVQQPPRLEPGDRDDARVEEHVIAEEEHVAPLSRRGEDGGEEAAGFGEDREDERVLLHGEERGERGDRDEQPE